ncbi:hypothetical protein AX15_007837 [Amanita polypyramis BW_CC]|nr:hypothetical protein AX15_007837 [Amanita polypyramis BW_CC]
MFWYPMTRKMIGTHLESGLTKACYVVANKTSGYSFVPMGELQLNFGTRTEDSWSVPNRRTGKIPHRSGVPYRIHKNNPLSFSNPQQAALSTAMRSLFAYSLLVVQLLVVRFVTAQKYAIGSDRTNFWIINSDVSVGSDVRTARGAADHQPSDIALFLNINPSPEPTSLNNHTIYDDNTNLYIGIEEVRLRVFKATLTSSGISPSPQARDSNGSPTNITG